MKKIKGLLVFILSIVSIILLNNTKCLAEEIQYTDNVIPAMTGNTSPSGVASASSVYTENSYDYSAWKVFDHDVTTKYNGWITSSGIVKGWLEYDFQDARCITKYTIVNRPLDTTPDTILTQLPKNWTFEAYNEETDEWIVLDTRKNIMDWSYGVKKEFTFTNTSIYNKYRINIQSNCGSNGFTSIGELEMMETVSAPINLTATANTSDIKLSWSKVNNASYYNIKRSTISGEEVIIATGSNITYVDTDVEPGTTYYYLVNAVIDGIETINSNEVSATPQASTDPNEPTGNKALLVITMATGERKEYEMTSDKINDFIAWYNSKAASSPTYVIEKDYNKASFTARKDYIAYEQISNFEVNEYNN